MAGYRGPSHASLLAQQAVVCWTGRLANGLESFVPVELSIMDGAIQLPERPLMVCLFLLAACGQWLVVY